MKRTGISDEAGSSPREPIQAHQTLGRDHLKLRKIDAREAALLNAAHPGNSRRGAEVLRKVSAW